MNYTQSLKKIIIISTVFFAVCSAGFLLKSKSVEAYASYYPPVCIDDQPNTGYFPYDYPGWQYSNGWGAGSILPNTYPGQCNITSTNCLGAEYFGNFGPDNYGAMGKEYICTGGILATGLNDAGSQCQVTVAYYSYDPITQTMGYNGNRTQYSGGQFCGGGGGGGYCGDGICGTDGSGQENNQTCPQDCAAGNFNITVSPPSRTINQGEEADFTVTIQPVGKDQNNVTLSPWGACPTNAICAFVPPIVNLDNGAATAEYRIYRTGTTPAQFWLTGVQGSDGTNVKHQALTLNINTSPWCDTSKVGTNQFLGCQYDINFTAPTVVPAPPGPSVGSPADNVTPLPPTDISSYGTWFGLRFKGNFTFSGGNYIFNWGAADGMKVYLDDNHDGLPDNGYIINGFPQNYSTVNTSPVAIPAGVHRVVVDYEDAADPGVYSLSWALQSGGPPPPATISAVSVSPSSGSSNPGQAVPFTYLYTDTLGANDITDAYTFVGPTLVPQNACYLHYIASSNSLSIMNDAGTTWSAPLVVGVVGTLSNSQCSIQVGSSSVTKSGTNFTLVTTDTFTASFVGTQQAWMSANNASINSGWQPKGSWTIQAGSPPPTASFTVNGSHSITVTNGTVLNYIWSSTNANSYGSTYTSSTCGSGSWSSFGANSASGTASYTASQPGCTFDITYTASSTISGLQAQDTVHIVEIPAGPAIFAVSVSPPSGSSNPGQAQNFSYLYTDTLGANDITDAYTFVGPTLVPQNACYLHYIASSNSLSIMNDAGTTWSAPLVVGVVGTLSNSQCSIQVGSSSVTKSGQSLTLVTRDTFNASFAGNQQAWMYANNASINSGWQENGTWTITAPVNGVCGTANKTYPVGSNSYGSDTYCATGNPSSSPPFPPAGNSASWTCLGSNGGSDSPTCTAINPPLGTQYSVTVTKAIGGTVNSLDGFIACGSTCSHNYNSGTLVILQAQPSTYWKFIGWSGDCSGTGNCSLLVTSAKNVSATFVPLPFDYREF